MHPTASQIQTAQVQTAQSPANQPQSTHPQTHHFEDGQSQKAHPQIDHTQVKPSQNLQSQKNLATPPHKETSSKTNRPKKTPPAGADNTTDTTPANQIEAIQKEGLTGRRLRMARRIANEYKLPAQTDFDAVRLLRAKGIDPFNRSNPLDWISPEQNQNKSPSPDNAKVQLPQKIEKAPETLPSNRRQSYRPPPRRNPKNSTGNYPQAPPKGVNVIGPFGGFCVLAHGSNGLVLLFCRNTAVFNQS